MSTYTVFHPTIKAITQDWVSLLTFIIESQLNRFKINYSHQIILHNHETTELQFYHASFNNAPVLDMPRSISVKQDFDHFIKDVQASYPLKYAFKTRPNTKWEVEMISYTCLYLYHFKGSISLKYTLPSA